MADDGFHEIQLGRKQLLFAGLVAVVSLMMAFLIGVWAGRGVQRADSEIAADQPVGDVVPDSQQPPTQVPTSELDYAARLQGDATKMAPKTGEAELQKDPPKPIEPPTPVEGGPPEPEPAPAQPPVAAKGTAPPAPAAAKPAAGNLLLQVGAFGTRGPATALVSRLKGKGYAAFVFSAPSGPSRFKVRIGPFADRAEADRISAKLKKEERLSPLVTR